eukprot:CAMPEP_0168730186 /NCGR_PEP_ID=MMETSP0724-20121128/6603_1 /TAXON_ID=265536 /ORGANISM="Amphiprora sp., Strain CCMP467" /LENGTH=1375 /DNA_ID=CAMNT_0008777121 /DNA_START=24 /DNA_END=4148 /DNA_ORIENTATION=-
MEDERRKYRTGEESDDFSHGETEDQFPTGPPVGSGGAVSFSDLAKKIQSDPRQAAANRASGRIGGGLPDNDAPDPPHESLVGANDSSSTQPGQPYIRTGASSKSLHSMSEASAQDSQRGGVDKNRKGAKSRASPRDQSRRQVAQPTGAVDDGSNQKRANLLASRLTVRATAVKTRLDRRGGNTAGATDVNYQADNVENGDKPTARRFKPGDNVLVCNQQSRWSTLVNRHGFPPGEGATPEEQRGPYIYAMATVKQVHFEEFAAYYTVTRADTGAEQRADTDFMEPIRTIRGEQAAFRAAMQSSLEGGPDDSNAMEVREAENDQKKNKIFACLENTCFLIILPLLWIYDMGYYLVSTFLAPVGRFLKNQARLILTGQSPYACQLRMTVVNFVVLCSIWYMFVDQARLAFFPPESDYPVAVINFIVWLMLGLELFFEVFIRPDGYKNLIISEKAFSPQTVRYINLFHFLVESLSLALFVPEFVCIFMTDSCSERFSFSFYNAALMSVTGPSQAETVMGRCYFALIRLRVFGLVRHWRNMWITNTFLHRRRGDGGFLSNIFPQRSRAKVAPSKQDDSEANDEDHDTRNSKSHNKKQDETLTNASNIGTALMVTNSYRAISLLWVITGVFPIFGIALDKMLINNLAESMTKQLQKTNIIANDTSVETCDYLLDSTYSWIMGVVAPNVEDGSLYLLKLGITPGRCVEDDLSSYNLCTQFVGDSEAGAEQCAERRDLEGLSQPEMADYLGIRVGSIVEHSVSQNGTLLTFDENGSEMYTDEIFSVQSCFDETYTIRTAARASVMLQLTLLLCVLGGLSVLRRDAEVLVLGPLRRMLKIVARYAQNPLVQPKLGRMRSSRRHKLSQRVISRDDDSMSSYSSESTATDGKNSAWRNDSFALGSYETEQLIAAVTKITDLLRKCWGVAGADIISTNLATREGELAEVFNPTVPGKSVYALFAFAAINDFDHALRNLGGDVMILINDVAQVLHGEVFRWGFGDSGQCNKNLGGAFLMVFRIGLVKEVIKKLEQATDVIWTKTSQPKVSQALKRRGRQQQPNFSPSVHRDSSNSAETNSSIPGSVGGKSFDSKSRHALRRINDSQRVSVKAMSLSLASLPGISTFTDRAVIGMLKAFASIHRDHKLRSWNNDIRLGYGVGAFTVSMIYGMDAGWAVEGAVGSEYKIDATYLSPHVNMASRMMSACKQYGVSIMLSQAVQELMSDVARSKLRHLDTVTVKGSSVKQKIYTYDARHRGADFFLYSRSDEQADVDADRYTPNIWNTDQDLKAMRQHVTEDFLAEFNEGRKMFLLGEWSGAQKRLERANELMVENALEDGFLEEELEEIQNQALNPKEAAEELKKENGDGPSQCLLDFIQLHGGVLPLKW